MTQYEYKVIKIPIIQQNYYCSFLACFGWQVQNIQESVDRVVNRSLGFSHNTNYGSMNATTYFHPYTNSAHTYGYSRNHGWGTQMNMDVTDVQISLTITFFRDSAIPYRNELVEIENRFIAASPAYLNRCARDNNKNQDAWPERQAVQACANAGREVLERGARQAQSLQSEQTVSKAKPQEHSAAIAIPAEPPTANIREISVVHNVIQSSQTGMQIQLKFSIQNRKGIECRAVVYFYDDQFQPLQDINQRFQSVDGKVSVGAIFNPDYTDAYYNDYVIFMPYDELDQKDGEFIFNLKAYIYDEITGKFLAESSNIRFSFIKHGSDMRGNDLPAAASTEVKKDVPKPSSRKRPQSDMIVEEKAAAPRKRPSYEKYAAIFCQNYGWDDLTEDRKVFLQGFALDYENKRSQARKFYKQALSINNKEPIYWERTSQEYFEKGQFGEAVKFLEKALKVLPGNPAILYLLGHALVGVSNLDQAQKMADGMAVVEDKYSRISYYFLLGEIAEARQDYRTAIKFYDQADQLRDPEERKYTKAHQERCRSLMEKASGK